jgi:hypothetical protein
MALSVENALGIRVPGYFEDPTPVAPRIPLGQGEPVPVGEPRSDNVGVPDFATLAETPRLTPDLFSEGLHGFDAYQKAGGVFSKGLYEKLMDGVLKLQEPGVRKKSIFTTPTEWQIRGFEDKHNKPFLGTELPPEEQIFLTEAQKDAYCLFRNSLSIPEEDRRKGAYFNDASLLEEILKMPNPESYLLYSAEQEQRVAEHERLQALAIAA